MKVSRRSAGVGSLLRAVTEESPWCAAAASTGSVSTLIAKSGTRPVNSGVSCPMSFGRGTPLRCNVAYKPVGSNRRSLIGANAAGRVDGRIGSSVRNDTAGRTGQGPDAVAGGGVGNYCGGGSAGGGGGGGVCGAAGAAPGGGDGGGTVGRAGRAGGPGGAVGAGFPCPDGSGGFLLCAGAGLAGAAVRGTAELPAGLRGGGVLDYGGDGGGRACRGPGARSGSAAGRRLQS